MKRTIIIIFIMLSCVFSLFGCSKSNDAARLYEEGYRAGYQDGYKSGSQTASENDTKPVSQTEKDEIEMDPLPEPENGFVFSNINISLDMEMSTLKVQSANAGGYYFVVKPVEFSGNFTESWRNVALELSAKYMSLQFYVRSNSTVEVDVPLGEYCIYYAQGERWYGETELFGDETKFYKCEETFLFEKNTSGNNGWEISLHPTQGGNMTSKIISKEDFIKVQENK